MAHVPFSELVGKTLVTAEVNQNRDEITFVTTEGERYKLLHFPDCCESVYIEDIDGDMEDLIGSPILVAEEVSNQELDTLRLIAPEVFKAEQGSRLLHLDLLQDRHRSGWCLHPLVWRIQRLLQRVRGLREGRRGRRVRSLVEVLQTS